MKLSIPCIRAMNMHMYSKERCEEESDMHFKTIKKVAFMHIIMIYEAMDFAVLLIVKQLFPFLLISICLLIISLGSEALLFYDARKPHASIKSGIQSFILLILLIYLLFFR